MSIFQFLNLQKKQTLLLYSISDAALEKKIACDLQSLLEDTMT